MEEPRRARFLGPLEAGFFPPGCRFGAEPGPERRWRSGGDQTSILQVRDRAPLRSRQLAPAAPGAHDGLRRSYRWPALAHGPRYLEGSRLVPITDRNFEPVESDVNVGWQAGFYFCMK